MAAAVAIRNALYGERRGYATIRARLPPIATPTLIVGLSEGSNRNVVPDKVTLRLTARRPRGGPPRGRG